MNKINRELDDFRYVRHVPRDGENYYLTIIDEKGIQTINMSEFKKNKITFGNDKSNDIIIESIAIDFEQGYFEIDENGLKVVNTSDFADFIVNNNKIINEMYLLEGSFIKVIINNSGNPQGIIMIISINKSLDEWKCYPLSVGTLKIGSGDGCDLILTPSGVARHHATIHRNAKNKVTIRDEWSINGTYVNSAKLRKGQEVELNYLDVIYIGNSKIVLIGDELYYQIFDRSIRLDAIDIVKKVDRKYKQKQIMSHISINIEPAEFVAFVGPSGAGKSTLLKCISGVDTPTSGTVLLNGEDLHENYKNLKYNIGYVPQDDILYSNLTVHDMLHYSAKLRMPDNTTDKFRNQRIKEVLETVQLSDFENSYIKQLSGGQRKRVSIAVELIADPNLFFLDEPTSGLDPGTERSIMKTLRKMSRMGKTTILVTHNTMNLHLCDKIAFLGEGGVLCFYGTPKEALEFFNVDDFVDIYNIIDDDAERWSNEFQKIYKFEEPEVLENYNSNNIASKKKSFIKQLINLIKRSIKLISNNLIHTILLIIQAPVMALSFTLVATSDLYKGYDNTKGILFSFGCACVWMGLLNAVNEICKERVILQKECMADLKLSAYILSKFIVQAIFAFIQSFLLVLVFQLIEGKSTYSILINGFWDMQIICFLTIVAASGLGLFISALVKNASIAMLVVPALLLAQLAFSGMFFPLEGFTDMLSNIILCRWSVEGLGTSANLNAMTHSQQLLNPFITIEPEKYFIFTTEHMYQVMGVILLMTVIELVACYVVLRKNVNKNI